MEQLGNIHTYIYILVCVRNTVEGGRKKFVALSIAKMSNNQS